MVSGYTKPDGSIWKHIRLSEIEEMKKEIQDLKSQLDKKVMTIEELYKRMKQSESQNEKLQKVIDEIRVWEKSHNCGSYGCQICEHIKSILSKIENKK
jgi:predicted nuclease with TOPRIM domain